MHKKPNKTQHEVDVLMPGVVVVLGRGGGGDLYFPNIVKLYIIGNDG